MQNQAEIVIMQLSEVVETARSMAGAVARTCDLLDGHLARISTEISTTERVSDIEQKFDRIFPGADVLTDRDGGNAGGKAVP